jgi:hypothetical protein
MPGIFLFAGISYKITRFWANFNKKFCAKKIKKCFNLCKNCGQKKKNEV